jgi:hypothetical protein
MKPQSLLLGFYLVLWVTPAHWLFRRPSVLEYAGFFVIRYTLNVAGGSMRVAGVEGSACIFIVNSILFWGFARPLVRLNV